MALITFGSVIWAALTIGVLVPEIGAFLVAAVPAPDVIDRNWLRLAMLIGALAVPPVVGAASLFVVDGANRPKGRDAVAQVVRGYPLCATLALTLVILAGVGIVRFVHHKGMGWVDAHVPIVVHPGGYDKVVADLERALDDAGLAMDRRPAPLPLAIPGRMLARIAGSGIRSLVADRPVELVGKDLEIGLYPSDIAIGGKKLAVARARSAIATRLTATAASMTTSAEAQAVEGTLEGLSASRVAGARPGAGRDVDLATAGRTLASVDEQLATLDVSHEEWEILYRQRLQVERDLLAGRKPASVLPSAAGSPLQSAVDGQAAGASGVAGQRGLAIGTVIAVAGFVLIALDVVVAFLAGRSGRRR